jgi:hypothetical protein
MNKFRPSLRRVAKFLNGQRIDASAASVSGFDDCHSSAGPSEFAGSYQPRSAGADDQEIRQMRWGYHGSQA